MLSQPTCCHTSDHTYTLLNSDEEPSRSGASLPNRLNRLPTRPVLGDSRMTISPTMTTVEMKCGIYETVWKKRRNRFGRI
ncbi:hypothetical protein D3C86_1779160 [compost metagenome]